MPKLQASGAFAQALDDNARALNGAYWKVYAAGTTTQATTYSNALLTIANAWPVIGDAAGRLPDIYVAPGNYRIRVETAGGVLVAESDNNVVYGIDPGEVAAAKFKTAALMLTNETMAYAAGGGASIIVAAGDIVEAGGFRHIVAASGASDQGLTTAGGVKLYPQPIKGVMSAAQWAPAADGATDDTDKLQAAMDFSHANNANLFIPAGHYLVTGLVIPGTTGGPDDRDKAFRIFGQGTGEPFVHTNTGGTVIRSVTDAPVLTDILGTDFSSNGTVEIDHIRFDGNSTTPVVKLTSFYGLSSFHHNVIYQRGTGGGFETGWGATVNIHDNYAMNTAFATTGLGAARTGTGFSWVPTGNNGLVTFSKNTARGFLFGFKVGEGAGAPYSVTIEKCECSVVRNGILIGANCLSANIVGCYIEGGDGGTAIENRGDKTSIRDNLIFSGFSTAIRDTEADKKGTLIQGNTISLGAVENAIGVDVLSNAGAGGFNKTVSSNYITYTLGTDGVSGIKVAGQVPRVTLIGNAFDPKEAWTGTGTFKVNDISTGNGLSGFVTTTNGNWEVPFLAQGGISLFRSAAALTEADVATNTLTLPDGVSYFTVTATASATVQIIDGGSQTGRIVILRTTNANMTIQDTSFIQLAGAASFTGPGTITFFIDIIAGQSYAYEIARAVF